MQVRACHRARRCSPCRPAHLSAVHDTGLLLWLHTSIRSQQARHQPQISCTWPPAAGGDCQLQRAHLQVQGDEAEVEELEGDPDLPVHQHGWLQVLLQLVADASSVPLQQAADVIRRVPATAGIREWPEGNAGAFGHNLGQVRCQRRHVSVGAQLGYGVQSRLLRQT